jgi:putative transposase
MKKAKQLNLNLHKGKRGGRRPGSGRKRIHSQGVAHRSREKVKKTTPLHINFKIQKGGLRSKSILKFLKHAILKARHQGLHITHFSLQTNHVHLMVEAYNNQILSQGMRSLLISFSKKLNFYWKQQGQVMKERYHLHVLRTLRETQNALKYVLQNDSKHHTSYLSEFSAELFKSQTWLLRKATG